LKAVLPFCRSLAKLFRGDFWRADNADAHWRTLFRRAKKGRRRQPSRSSGWRGAPLAFQPEALETRAMLAASLAAGQLDPASYLSGTATTSIVGCAAASPAETSVPTDVNSPGLNARSANSSVQPGGGGGANINGSSTAAEGTTYTLNLSPSPSITGWDVTWGDGHVESVSGDAASVSHVFVEEGNDDISAVAHTTSGDVPSNTVHVTVSEPAIEGASATLTPIVEGQAAATIEIATFTHAGGVEPPSHFSATVDWGQGSVATDAVTQDNNGTYHVRSSRPVFAEEGSYPVTVVISDDDAPAVTSTVQDTLAVSEPSILGSSVTLPTINEGDASAMVEMATFTHAGGVEPPTDFTVVVNWGLAGHLSDSGMVSRDDTGLYHVTAARPVYAEESGGYTVVVFVFEDGASTLVNDSQAVLEPAIDGTAVALVGINEGDASATVDVATFAHAHGVEPATDFTATVDWGVAGHHADSGLVALSGGVYHVTAARPVYSEEGNYAVSVSISEDGGANSMVVGSLGVNEPSIVGSSAVLPALAEGNSSPATVATFTHAGGVEPANDFMATVDWGLAGHSADAAAVSQPGGPGTQYVVTANRPVFGQEGTYPVHVTISEDNVSTVVDDSQVVTDPAVVAQGGYTVNAGIQFDSGPQTLATFTDPGGAEPNASDPGTIADHYSATIDWGDTASTAGTISYDGPSGTFTVTGSHTYSSSSPADYTIAVTINHEATTAQVVTSTAHVVAPTVDLSGSHPNPVNETSTFTLVLGTISDPSPAEQTQIEAYHINWGDGSPLKSHSFSGNWTTSQPISLTHTYLDGPATETIHVGLQDASGIHPDSGVYTLSVSDVSPTATFGNFGSVSEGSTGFVAFTNQQDVSSVDQSAGFTYGYDFNNDGIFEIQNTASASATVPASFLSLGPLDQTIRGRIIDKDGGFSDYTTTIHVDNVAPIVNVSGNAAVNQSALFARSGSFIDPGADTWVAQVDYGAGDGFQPLALNPNKTFTLSHTYATPNTYQVTVRVTDHGGAGPNAATGSASFQIVVNATTFQVSSFSGNNSGFDATFNRAADASQLNLYRGANVAGVFAFGLPDVTVTGQSSGAVHGSLAWDSATNTAHFVAFSGALAPDTYTVDLASRSDGWTDTSGSLLDGLGNGISGSGDFLTSFDVAPPSVPVLGLPSFARGPGQNVDVNADGTARTQNLPLHLSDTTGVRSVDFEIDYDPSLLNLTNVIKAAGIPADWSVTKNSIMVSSTSARLLVTLWGMSALAGPASDVLDLVGSIPSTAPYGAAQLLKPINVLLNEGNIGVLTEEALEKVAYFGDATGNTNLSGLDATLISRNVVHLDDGLSAYPLTDPRIIADATGDGTLSGLDASEVANASVHNPEPTIPAVPAHSVLVTSGVDPTITIPLGVMADPGQSVNVPVSITDDAVGLSAADFDLVYANHGISLSNSGVTTSSYLASQGWGFAVNVDDLAGEAFITVYSKSDPLPSGTPQLLNLQYQVPATTAPGEYPITLVVSDSRLNEGQLALTVQGGSLIVVDPLTVLNTNDDGVGSLRQVINYANTLAASSSAIRFAIPPGPQTIDLLTPLSASTRPLIVELDASQNVFVVSPSGGGRNNYGALTKVGAGSLTIAGANRLTGNLQVDDGTLRFDLSATSALTPGLTAVADGTGTLELSGSVSAFTGGSGGVDITNNSTAAAGVLVSGSNQFAGGIDGTGDLAIGAGGDLTANHVVQNALVIGGTADSPATLTISASDSSGNPMAATPTSETNGSQRAGARLTRRMTAQAATSVVTAASAPAVADSSIVAESAAAATRTEVESFAGVTSALADLSPVASVVLGNSTSSAAESSAPAKVADWSLSPAAVAAAFDYGDNLDWLESARALRPSSEGSSDSFCDPPDEGTFLIADELLEAIGRGWQA
jgi:autotransporter-associated beta strand protein